MTCGEFGGVTTKGAPCARTAGWGVEGTSEGRCITHLDQDATLPTGSTSGNKCGDYGGVTQQGRPCQRAAGWGVPGENTGRCRTHRSVEPLPPSPDPDPDPVPPPPTDPPPPPPVDPPGPGDPEPETWDALLANTTVQGNVVVPSGQRWLIGAGVVINRGSLIVQGGATAGFRPGSSLTFTGGLPDEYVGGGMRWDSTRALDFGLWVDPQGVLDIQGTPKKGMSRTGTHASWLPGDELWIAPTAVGDYSPRRWYPGDPIPQVAGCPAAEVINVTRDIVIQGVGHIHIHAHGVVTVRNVQLRGLGVANVASGGPVLGRYALHMHHGGDSTRGSLWEGVAAIDCRGRVFVPHGVHGVTVRNCVSVNSWGDGVWWDMRGGPEDRSDDVLIEDVHISGTSMPRSASGTINKSSPFILAGGLRNIMRHCSASGAKGGQLNRGFDWPSGADNFGLAVWEFEEGNVAHNCQGGGARFWNNNSHPHETRNFLTYRNGKAGIENGAYGNANFFEDITMLGGDRIYAQASGRRLVRDDPSSRPQTWRRVTAHSVHIGHLRLGHHGDGQHYEQCAVEIGVTFDANQRLPWFARFTGCTVAGVPLVPSHIAWPSPMLPALEGSLVYIDNGPGQRWRINVTNGQVVVTTL
jgi:hypothetical protein